MADKNFKQMLDEFDRKCQDVLVQYVKEGYLKTFAMIMVYLPLETRQELMASLDQDKVQKINHYIKENSEIREICRLEVESAFASSEFYPLDDLLDIQLQRMKEKNTENDFLDFKDKNPIYGDYLDTMDINFSKILYHGDENVKRLIEKVDIDQLAKACTHLSSWNLDRIFRNMGESRRKILNDKIEDLKASGFSEEECELNQKLICITLCQSDYTFLDNYIESVEKMKENGADLQKVSTIAENLEKTFRAKLQES
ncbi:MAG: hypothetical protein K6G52_00780, partial [Treponemataceae bacterium]|nr:hypothetical protein [Treponemataceae bacterium]